MPKPEAPTDVASLINLFGGPKPLRDVLNAKRDAPLSRGVTYTWRTNNYIPSNHWRAIVKVARDCGFEGITYALLAGFPRPQGRDEPKF